jgi:DNA-binding NarL/FixJ family response regulator
MLLDDHPIIREGIRAILSAWPDLAVVAEAGTVEEALAVLSREAVDLVVVDLMLGDALGGLEVVKTIHDRHPGCKALVLSMYADKAYADQALQAGASGYLAKGEASSLIVSAIRTVLQGGCFLSPSIAQAMTANQPADGTPQGADPAKLLTPRELSIFEELGLGKTSKEIAGHLGLSPSTVDTHRENIKRKLGLVNSAELLHRAIGWVLAGKSSGK